MDVRKLFGQQPSIYHGSSEPVLNEQTSGSAPSPQILGDAPPACECARIARRPLQIVPWINGVSENKFADRLNLELSHQHILFQLSGDNIGFGPKGLFSEETAEKGYRLGTECLDGEKLRQAVAEVPTPGKYGFFTNNCQVYVERVLQAYRRLVGKG